MTEAQSNALCENVQQSTEMPHNGCLNDKTEFDNL